MKDGLAEVIDAHKEIPTAMSNDNVFLNDDHMIGKTSFLTESNSCCDDKNSITVTPVTCIQFDNSPSMTKDVDGEIIEICSTHF